MSLLTDLPVETTDKAKSAFGFGTYSQVLTTVVMESDSPLTIGIFGDWGTGKTSLMKMVYTNLDNSYSNVFPIWFNAWRFEHEKNPILSLLYTHIPQQKCEKKSIMTYPQKHGYDSNRI